MKFIVARNIIFLLFILTSFFGYANENLVKNGSFEEVQKDLPVGWNKDAHNKSYEVTNYYTGKTKLASGIYKHYVTIENIRENDARLIQRISVKPYTNYKLSCFIKAENCKKERKGANVSVIHGAVLGTSRDFKDTQGKWEYVEYYINTDKEQENLTVAVRLGGFGSVTTGKASFYDFSIIEVDENSAVKVERIRDTGKKLFNKEKTENKRSVIKNISKSNMIGNFQIMVAFIIGIIIFSSAVLFLDLKKRE